MPRVPCPSLGENDLEELVRTRRHLHQWPELAFSEHRTAELVARRLGELGLEVRTGVGGTGVCGLLGAEGVGRCLALRADMDALAVEEVVDRPYRSQNPGVMHACGHDGHVATLLAALKVLARERDALSGRVKAIFQPAEEGGGGASRMISDGVLESPTVDAAVGLHYWTYLPTGTIGVKAGPSMASVDDFTLTVRGRGGHAALPHQASDALVAAAAVVGALQTVASRRVDPLQPVVVTVGQFQAGTAFNIIPEEARLTGTVRTFDPGVWAAVPGHLEQVVAGVCAAHGCAYRLDYQRHHGPLVNDPAVAALVREVAVELVGADRVVEVSTMGGEDMGDFLAAVPGCFFFVGAADEGKGITAPHHSPAFDLDEDALAIGAEMLVRVARRYLGPAR